MPCEAPFQRPAEQVAGVQELADVEERLPQVILADVREERDGLAVQRSVEHPRPELHGPVEPRLVESVGREIAERRVGQQLRFAARLRAKRDQRAVPIDLMLAHAHGRIDHAIAEEPSGGQPVGHVLEIGGRRPRTVEQELVVVAPDLGVAGHRLVVEADVVGSGAEEHVGQLVLGAGDGQGVFIARIRCQRCERRNVSRTGP